MTDCLARNGWRGWLALVGIAFVLVFAPLAPRTGSIAGFSVDAVMLTVPIAILLCVPLLTTCGRRAVPRVGIELPALVFLAWALISFLFTGMQPNVLATWVRYAAYILLVYAAAAVAADPLRRRLMLWIFALAGSVTVFHGFWQYRHPTGAIGMTGLDATVATRVFSTFDNPNFFAEFLVLLFAATLALVFLERGWLRYPAAVLLLAQAMALLLTYTRGSWLALAFGLFVGIMMIDSRMIWPFALGGAALIPFVPGALSRVLSIFDLGGTTAYRLTLWKVAGVAISERPVFGVGLGRFYDAFTHTVLNHPELNVGVLIYGAHQSYFQIAAEVGVIGAVAFAWMVFEACRMGGYYTVRMGDDTRLRLVNSALTAGLIALAINALSSNAFQHPRGAVFFFVLAGIQAGIGAQYFDRPAETRELSVNPAGVWAHSVLGRVYGAVQGAITAAWMTSRTRTWLKSQPIGAGRLLANSLVARALFGEGARDLRD